jgi:hypothetical protein
MQINQKMVKRTCIQLRNRIDEKALSIELRYLGLVLLKEIMNSPLVALKKRKGIKKIKTKLKNKF